MHVPDLEERTEVWAGSAAELWVAPADGVQGTAGFAKEEPESQRGCEAESQK